MNPHIQRAQMLYQRSRYADAERELGMALQVDPHEPWAYALLGACKAAQDDFAKAEELGQQALALAPDSADIRHLVARIQLARNDLPTALKTIDETIELSPHNADYYATRATIYSQMKKWNKALADCEAALAIDPEHVEAINVRSHARRAKGDTHTATQELRQALELDPDDPYSHSNLGWTHLQRGELKEAELHFREALRLDPELEIARVGVLETLKAKVPFYRWVLNYFIWMQTKAAGAQWGIIIGLYVIYRVLRGVAADNPSVAPFIAPFLILYSLFALATWFAKPLADTALLLHPFGRLALTGQEKREGAIVTTLVLLVTALLGAYFSTGQDVYALFAILIGSPGLALAMSFKFEPTKPRRILQGAAAGLALASLLAGLHEFTPLSLPEGLLSLLFQILVFSIPGTLIGTNILATQRWKR
ncbi:tetratricopeptide repeat protein [Aeoliella sp.]|uniref:tetratricopeptide repeat protein n=1 Tax=Aeoliella sp. TaxID=2795800 RepID=UPI003CCBA0A9